MNLSVYALAIHFDLSRFFLEAHLELIIAFVLAKPPISQCLALTLLKLDQLLPAQFIDTSCRESLLPHNVLKMSAFTPCLSSPSTFVNG